MQFGKSSKKQKENTLKNKQWPGADTACTNDLEAKERALLDHIDTLEMAENIAWMMIEKGIGTKEEQAIGLGMIQIEIKRCTDDLVSIRSAMISQAPAESMAS